jgi:FtsX-like permease family
VWVVVAYRLRADLRNRGAAMLALIVLIALLGGVVLATAAGAWRTASAYDRLLGMSNPPELLVSPPGAPGAIPEPFYDEVAEIPGVRAIARIAGLPLVPEAGTPSERLAEALGGIGVVASVDGGFGTEVARPRVVEGRLPDPTRAEEILVSARFASVGEVQVGDHIDAVLLTESETNVAGQVAHRDQGRPIRLVVTGIGVSYDEVVPFGDLNSSGSILATGPLSELVDRRDWNFEGVTVDAEADSDLSSLAGEIERLGQDPSLGTGGPVFVSDQKAAAQRVDASMQPLAVSLAVAAMALAVVGMLVIGQAIARASREPLDDVLALQAAGVRPVDRVGMALGRAAVVGGLGALGAVAVALALSPRFPIGVARVAEPDPGPRVDPLVLGVGAIGLLALTMASAVLAVVARLRKPTSRAGTSRLAATAAAAGLAPAAVQGVRFATLSGGPRPVPMRSTLVAVTVAITAVAASVTFADSLIALLDTPARYGQGWDRMVDAQFGPAPATRILDRLEGSPEIRGIAVGSYGDLTIEGVPVPAFDLTPVRGQVSVTIVEGRAPAGPDEIVLGSETLEDLGVNVGSRVEVDTGDGVHAMEITGRGVFPHMGQGSFSTTGLGVGAQLGGGRLASVFDEQEVPPDYVYDGRTFHFVAIDYVRSSSALDAELLDVEESVAADDGFVFTRREQPPTRILDLDRVRLVPSATAVVLALVAIAALAHLLVTSVAERRRELALLRTLGFLRRQLRATVAWQASVITLTALVVGLPLGVAIGRAVWRSFADGLHAAAPAETQWVWLLAAVLASLGVANLVAAIPSRTASRTSPAETLREG